MLQLYQSQHMPGHRVSNEPAKLAPKDLRNPPLALNALNASYAI